MYERKPASPRGVVQPQVARSPPGIVGDRAFDRAAGRDQGANRAERIQQGIVEGGRAGGAGVLGMNVFAAIGIQRRQAIHIRMMAEAPEKL